MFSLFTVAVAGASGVSYPLANFHEGGLLIGIWTFVGIFALLELGAFVYFLDSEPSALMLEASDALAYRKISQGDSSTGLRTEKVRKVRGAAVSRGTTGTQTDEAES